MQRHRKNRRSQRYIYEALAARYGVCHVEFPDPQSPAALAALCKQYAKAQKKEPPHFVVWLRFRKKYFSFLKSLGPLFSTFTCQYCGKEHLDPHTKEKSKLATLDHIIPLAAGGPEYDITNIAIACFHCNNKKADKLEFVPVAA